MIVVAVAFWTKSFRDYEFNTNKYEITALVRKSEQIDRLTGIDVCGILFKGLGDRYRISDIANQIDG